jgi:hypothetical protein
LAAGGSRPRGDGQAALEVPGFRRRDDTNRHTTHETNRHTTHDTNRRTTPDTNRRVLALAAGGSRARGDGAPEAALQVAGLRRRDGQVTRLVPRRSDRGRDATVRTVQNGSLRSERFTTVRRGGGGAAWQRTLHIASGTHYRQTTVRGKEDTEEEEGGRGKRIQRRRMEKNGKGSRAPYLALPAFNASGGICVNSSAMVSSTGV